jgi:hypothetical protein
MFKFNATGTELWSINVGSNIVYDPGKRAGNDAQRETGDFDLDSAGNILLAIQGNEYQFDCTGPEFPTPPCGNLNVGYFVRKLNSNGQILWTRRIDSGRIGTDFGGSYTPSIVVDTDNAIYVSGQTAGSFNGFTNEGSLDIFVTRLNADATRRWLIQFGSSNYDEVNGIGIKDGLYVAGLYNFRNIANSNGTLTPDGNSFLARISRSDGKIANFLGQ